MDLSQHFIISHDSYGQRVLICKHCNKLPGKPAKHLFYKHGVNTVGFRGKNPVLKMCEVCGSAFITVGIRSICNDHCKRIRQCIRGMRLGKCTHCSGRTATIGYMCDKCYTDMKTKLCRLRRLQKEHKLPILKVVAPLLVRL